MQNAVQASNPIISAHTVEGIGSTQKALVDAKEAAGMCGIGKSTWLRHTSSGKTPRPINLGRRTLWRVQELLDWIAAGCPGRAKWEAMRGGA